jgi:methionyl-tRNA synthetase
MVSSAHMNATALIAFSNLSNTLGISGPALWMLVIAIVIWTITLKGFALWHAARNYQRVWFLALLIINTFGVLELAYLLWFRADKDANRTPSLFNTPEGPEASASA